MRTGFRRYVLNALMLTVLIMSTGSCGAPSSASEQGSASPAESFAAEPDTQAAPFVPPDFSKPFDGIKQAYGTRYVLTILWDPEYPEKYNIEEDRPSRDIVENMLFGPKPSVRDYFWRTQVGYSR